MSKPSTEVHAGIFSVPLQVLTFSVAEVLKNLDPLVDENISTSKHYSSKWAEQNCEFQLLHYCLFFQRKSKKLTLYTSPNAAQ